MGITDDFGGLSAVTPIAAANASYPNLPYHLLVGVEPVLINDSDEYSDFGGWTTGLPGQDNATTFYYQNLRRIIKKVFWHGCFYDTSPHT